MTCHPEYNFDTNPRKLRNFQTMQKKAKSIKIDISDLELSADFSGLFKRAPGISIVRIS